MLQSKDTAPYTPTAEDRLWLSRAVQAEGRPQQMVARALVNLFMHARSRGSEQTLANLVRAYAQPVNPRWYPGGDLYAAEEATEWRQTQAERRREVYSTRTEFDPVVTAAVERALSTPYAGDITDYAASSRDASGLGYVPRSESVPGINRLWTRDPGWRGYVIGVGGSLAPYMLVAVGMWMAWRAV